MRNPNRRTWVCLGVTDDMHPWCPYETENRQDAVEHGRMEGHFCVDADDPKVAADQRVRNDDPAHIAAVAKVAEARGCDWPGHPCGRDIPEFNGRDAECMCETVAEDVTE